MRIIDINPKLKMSKRKPAFKENVDCGFRLLKGYDDDGYRQDDRASEY